MLRLSNLKLSIEQDKDEVLPKLIAKTLNIPQKEIRSYKIFKESIDARKEEIEMEIKKEKGEEMAFAFGSSIIILCFTIYCC